MIPKIIHYCWFGRGEMPQLALDCIASWHKYMPDWEYKLWDEDNFDVNSVQYVKEAYEARKFAFVSDYVRLMALREYGGVYMDTDVEVLKSLDGFLDLPAFIGFEGTKAISLGTAVMASRPGTPWLRELLETYSGTSFYSSDGKMDMAPNTGRITKFWRDKGLALDGTLVQNNDICIFPSDYFCPRKTSGEFIVTGNTCCDHHFMGSWTDGEKKPLLLRIAGPKISIQLIKLKRKILG